MVLFSRKMKILIEINHPAHLHFFRNAIKVFKRKDFEVLFAVRDKDLCKELAQEMQLKNVIFLRKVENLLEKILSFFFSTLYLFQKSLLFKPDIFLGWNSIYSGIISKILRKPFILFEDNEYSWSQLITRVPFATVVLTNSSFPQKFNKQHIYYNSYEELAYLHPNRFNPKKEIKKKYNIRVDKKLIVLRLIAWNATHDLRHHGLFDDREELVLFIQKLNNLGDLILSIEGYTPILVQNNRIMEVEPGDFLDLLYYADLYVGEGGTVAAEAAMLSTPAIYTSTLLRSYIKELSNHYKLIYTSTSKKEVLEKIEDFLYNERVKKRIKINWEKMINDKSDLTKYIVFIVENFYRINKINR